MEKNLAQGESNRIFYLDFARGLAVFFMIMQHAMIMHERTSGEGDTLLGNLFVLLGTAPAAPVFIFIMGVFAVRSKKSVAENMIRGCKIFAFGYVLNVLRFTIPFSLAGDSGVAMSHLFMVDIFQLAGLSLIFFSALKKLAEHAFILPAFILGILLISPYWWGLKSDLYIFDPLWGAGANTQFPLFPWGVYFLLGMYVSKHLQTQKLEEQIKKKYLMGCLILGIAGAAMFPLFPIGDYNRSGLAIHLLMMSFIFLWMVLADYFVKKLNKAGFQKLLHPIYFWSSHVTGIYIIQWVIFGWSVLLLGLQQMTDYSAMIFGFVVMLVTDVLLRFTNLKRILPKL
ncbi:heparan-alpha-glucosaminide N-acetyltransferase domain-containing protein [Brevibacillus sp. NPDC058079]|uniref:heparan-alpha-glucosaminide N-acetyltransferase domain-containing protein n=1 Tax=Brevibacillus sp. NPDC058079 TaxID=3346330 RepID=UPI0036EC98D1